MKMPKNHGNDAHYARRVHLGFEDAKPLDQKEAQLRNRLRQKEMEELLGRTGLEATFTRMKLMLERLLDNVWIQMDKLQPGEVEESLNKEARSLNDSLLKLVHEHRGLDKDGTFAVANMSRDDKTSLLVEFFRDLPIDEKKRVIEDFKVILGRKS